MPAAALAAAAATAAAAAGRAACDSSGFLTDSGTNDTKYASEPAAAAADCCALCAADARCGHWVWAAGSGNKAGECKLKSTASYAPIPKKGLVCGSAPPPTPPTPSPPTPVPPPTPPPAPLGSLPHFVFFLADDLGRYDVGFTGGNPEAQTPNLDALAKAGVVLDRHYVFQFCSPTRSSFLSGRLPVHVSVKNSELPDVNGVDVRMTTVADRLTARGYACHQVGKWHAGSTAVGQLPMNRGFKSSFGYLSGEEDHYTQMEKGYKDLWDTDAPAYNRTGVYNAFAFTDRAVSIIENHDTAGPLFLYQAWQEAHTPNQVPDQFLPSGVDFPLRRTYGGMVSCLDSGIGNVTAALRKRDMWDNTLIGFSSDNGGREDGNFGGNNYPLRGMKFSDFEGGTRVAALASGGLIPAARRGAVEAGLMHIADWLHTFCALAGADPTDPAAKGAEFPDIDSVDMGPTLLRGAASPRQGAPLPLSPDALIVWPHKVVFGKQGGKGIWTGPQSPNATKVQDNDPGCGSGGCLFDIDSDPTEHNDLAAAQPQLLANLTAVLDGLKPGFFQTHSDPKNGPPGYPVCQDIKKWAKAHQNFAGPVCYAQ